MNLGEVVVGASNRCDLHVATGLQAFGLIVTAEPYYSVSQPSDVVVLENVVRPDTVGRVEEVRAKYDLMPRGQYVYQRQPSDVRAAGITPKVSMDKYEAMLELYQAQNAVQIARSLGADRYAAETYSKAAQLLSEAQNREAHGHDMKAVVTVARAATQTAEDARVITSKRLDEQRLANEQRAAAAASAETLKAQERAQMEQQQAESERIAREQAQAEAERAKAAARQEAEIARAVRDTANTQPDVGRNRAQVDGRMLRLQVLRELAPVLDTRDSPRGLLVTIPDSLFRTPVTLNASAIDRLTRVAFVVRAHPGLLIEVDGHTDSQGSDSEDQALSESRAALVRDTLVRGGVPSNAIVIRGFGKTRPLLSNSSAAGRAENRRVEVVITGEPIGSLASWDQTYTLAPRR